MLGICQYIPPDISFFPGIFMFAGTLFCARLLILARIWFALALYTWESLCKIRIKRHKVVREK
jgi:EamA domain-containing membrane protein RarD